jgi:hypothetical protein
MQTAPSVTAGFGFATLPLTVLGGGLRLGQLDGFASGGLNFGRRGGFCLCRAALADARAIRDRISSDASRVSAALVRTSGSRAIRRFLVATGFTGSADTVASAGETPSSLTFLEVRAGLPLVSAAGCAPAGIGETVVEATGVLSVLAFDLRATLFAVTLKRHRLP